MGKYEKKELSVSSRLSIKSQKALSNNYDAISIPDDDISVKSILGKRNRMASQVDLDEFQYCPSEDELSHKDEAKDEVKDENFESKLINGIPRVLIKKPKKRDRYPYPASECGKVFNE